MSTLSIARAAEQAPHGDALVWAGAVLSFAELSARVEALAPRLERLPAETPVALTPRLDLESVCTMLACLERGVPMLLLHSRLTPTERERALAQVARAWPEAPRTWESLPARGSSPEAPRSPSSTLALVFTSGTTAAPRVAALSRRAFLAATDASAANLGWEPQDRWLLSLPPAHVGGLSIVIRCLVARRAMVLADSARFDPGKIARQLARDEVTLLSLVPAMLRRLLDHDAEWRPPASLRAILVGGAALSGELRREAVARGLPILATYGMTETCAQVATQPYARRGQLDAGVGPALPGVGLRVREGVVQVSGPTLMGGYVGVAREDQPFREDGWLVTRDLGRLDAEGTLHIEGRADDVIVSGGENVSPEEVEAALLALPGVAAAAVFGRPDPAWGERVCAALVLAAPAPSIEHLLASLRETLAAHKLPRSVAVLERLPSTPKGDVDRGRAARLALQAGFSAWMGSGI